MAEEKDNETSTLAKVGAVAGSAVIFTCVAYGTKRLLDRMFEPKDTRTVLLVHANDLHELGEGE